jgi:hypothetical protein
VCTGSLGCGNTWKGTYLKHHKIKNEKLYWGYLGEVRMYQALPSGSRLIFMGQLQPSHGVVVVVVVVVVAVVVVDVLVVVVVVVVVIVLNVVELLLPMLLELLLLLLLEQLLIYS